MDEIIMRRLRHLQWLEENHAKAIQAREGSDASPSGDEGADISNALSVDWNRRRKALDRAPEGQKLPCGWRNEHWKTQQSMARDYAGVNADCKEEAVSALEAYEAGGTVPPAA